MLISTPRRIIYPFGTIQTVVVVGSDFFSVVPFLPPRRMCRWNHSAVGVFAVPHWKVFVFGGNSGNLAEGGNPQVRPFVLVLCENRLLVDN